MQKRTGAEEFLLQGCDRNIGRREPAANGNLSGATGGFAQSHAGAHDADGRHGFVGGRDATAGYEEAADSFREKRTVGNFVAVTAIFQGAVVVMRTVKVNGVTAHRDSIRETATFQNVFPRHHVLADNAARFADAKEGCCANELGTPKAWNVADKEFGNTLNLAASLDFTGGEAGGVCAIDTFDAGHIHPDFAGSEASDDDGALCRKT